jgi:DNA-binding ferritin-like protein
MSYNYRRANSNQSVWQDPTSYTLDDGPSYLERRSSDGPDNVEKFSNLLSLAGLVPLLRATTLIHHTHHWISKGPGYYGDHLLFDRIYNAVDDQVDGVAERALGLSSDASLVDPNFQVQSMAALVAEFSASDTSPEDLVGASLRLERFVLSMIDATLVQMREDDTITNGVEDLLQGLSSAHETLVYLLQQRSQSPT